MGAKDTSGPPLVNPDREKWLTMRNAPELLEKAPPTAPE
jgi:hypothetical protein